jgi:hypothetical protein
MKMMIEISGGMVTVIKATEDCEIYLIDHDNLTRSAGYDPQGKVAISDLVDMKEAMHPDYVTGELNSDDNDETPEFDKLLNEALEPYQIED